MKPTPQQMNDLLLKWWREDDLAATGGASNEPAGRVERRLTDLAEIGIDPHELTPVSHTGGTAGQVRETWITTFDNRHQLMIEMFTYPDGTRHIYTAKRKHSGDVWGPPRKSEQTS